MPNRLAGETSVYLLQHQHNPVDWHPWSDSAWALARERDRPVLVSIGYSSCHWCHVMERECFEDSAIAQLMNEQLVSIKVDREERPDIDQIFMDAVMRLTGQGGWPLNMFCTPDGRPFFGGTYFPPERAHGRPSWPEIVHAVSEAYRDKRGDVDAQATRVIEAIESSPAEGSDTPVGSTDLGAFIGELMARADSQHGGFGAAPKFPTPPNLEAILYASDSGASRAGALEHLLFSLKRMARGGIYDQIGGGFHRYSTDTRWLVPHFEKMLYDQGQLLRVYAEAHRQTGEDELEWPIGETIGWLEREMRSEVGGFYASQDADSEGEEGKFYVWNRPEVTEVLGAEAAAFCDAYSVTHKGTFEDSGHSVLAHDLAGNRPDFATARGLLLEARSKRIPPGTDPKHIASWIGYAIGGVATAASSFGRNDWLETATRTADFVTKRMYDDAGRLLRIWDGTRARVPAFLDDHAALLCALLDLHRAGGGERFAKQALELADAVCARFFDDEHGDFFFAETGDETLVIRPASDSDGATPAANGTAVLGLVRAAALSGRARHREVADAVITHHSALARRVPAATPTLLRASALRQRGVGLALVLGAIEDPGSAALAARARRMLSCEDLVVTVEPGAVPNWLDPEWLRDRDTQGGVPTAYLCRGKTCSLPATRPEDLSLSIEP